MTPEQQICLECARIAAGVTQHPGVMLKAAEEIDRFVMWKATCRHLNESDAPGSVQPSEDQKAEAEYHPPFHSKRRH